MTRRRLPIAAVVCAAAACAASAQPVAPLPGPSGATPILEACRDEVRRAPEDPRAYECFRLSKLRHGDARAIGAAVRELHEQQPDNPLATLAYAASLRDVKQAEALARAALDAARRRGHRAAEGRAFLALARSAMKTLRAAEVEAGAERAEEIARETGDGTLWVLAQDTRARAAYLRGEYGRAWRLYRGLELAPEFEQVPPGEVTSLLEVMAMTAMELGVPESAAAYARRRLELDARWGFAHDVPPALSSLLHAQQNLYFAGRGGREGLAETGRRLADALRASRDHLTLAGVLLVLHRFVERAEADRYLAELERLVATDDRCGELRAIVARARGRFFGMDLPARRGDALRSLRAALEGYRARGHDAEVAGILADMTIVRVRSGDAGLDAAALDPVFAAIETLADKQAGPDLGAVFLQQYAPLYHGILDALLERAAPGDAETAFAVSERLRARLLLRSLASGAAAGAGNAGAGAAPDPARAGLLERMSRVQLQLIVDDLDAAARGAAERELERLENEEQGLRPAARRAPSRLDAAGALAALEPGRALLAFVFPSQPDLRGWVFALDGRRLRVHELADVGATRAAVRLWLGAIERRDGSEAAGATRLYRDLLAAALAELPQDVTRLTLIPDGLLHHVPFDALQPDPAAPALVERYEVEVAPSATAWRALGDLGERGAGERNEGPAVAGPPRALLLADPEPARAAALPATMREALSLRGATGRLPHARREGRAALAALGGRGDLRIGGDASEAFLKAAVRGGDGGYRVVHLAAHALVDEDHPGRSAVVLAPGADGEDGLLQPREVAGLALDGALVTLSACRSAAGTVVSGEGVMGLARAFFEARAAAVVGGLFPLRDDETAALMEVFYRELGRGRAAGEALAAAKRARRADGAPVAAWAGVTLLGSGRVAPFAGAPAAAPASAPVAAGAGSRGHGLLAGVAAGLILLSLVLVLVRLRRRS